jgi:hypothetical protein
MKADDPHATLDNTCTRPRDRAERFHESASRYEVAGKA